MRKFYILLFLIFSFCCFNVAYAQKENNIWYFGQYAGLDFNSGPPVPLTNSVMSTWEGSASVADGITGSLLFYTDGITVWNSSHVPMPNGTGLWGDESSTQSSVIVPKPGSNTLYYIFTTDAGTSGFPHGGVMAYSIVDMSLTGGLGDVTIKNVALFDTTTEKLSSARSSDGCHVWVIAHKWNSDEFYAFEVSDTGVSAPVISSAGSTHNCAVFGQLKVSPDGSKLALPLPCNGSANYVELFDFDNATGIVSNSVQLLQDHLVYGLDFSPNSKYLYTADHNNSGAIIYKQVAQYDVSLGSAAAINASRIIVGAVWNATTFFGGAAQLAPDGKIYIVPTSSDSLCVVNYPDSAGLACNFVVPGLYLGGPLNDHGLPNVVIKANYPCTVSAIFTAPHHVCPGTCTDFTNLSLNATSFQWIFPGGTPSTSTDIHPSNICYNTPGTYDVTLIASNGALSDTLTLPNYMVVYPYSPPQSIIQNGDTLFSNTGFVSYQWFYAGDTIPGATDYYYIATQSGDFSVVCLDDNGCSVEAVVLNVVASIQYTIDNEQPIMVYPNPVVDQFRVGIPMTIGTEFGVTAASVIIYNVFGETIFSAVDCLPIAIGMSTVDFRLPSAGVYYIVVVHKEKSFRTKIVKQ